jgi:hypothetical protein
MAGTEAERPLEDAEFPIDRCGLRLLVLSSGLVPPNISRPEIRSPQFPESWPQVELEAREYVVDAAFAIFLVISDDKIEKLVECRSFDRDAPVSTGCDFSQSLSQQSFGIFRTN